MGKTIRFNENGLIAIKNRLNEITAGNDDVVSPNDVSAVKLYHGTTIDALLIIMESGVMSAKRGKQHGETYGVNWFSLENGDNFNKGALFSIEVPVDVFNERFRMMNSSEAVSKDDDLDVTSFSLTIEKICGLSREGIKNAYNRCVGRGDRYPLESIGYLFDHFIERVQDDDVLFPSILYHNWDKYYPMIMKNILEDNINESVAKEFDPVTEIGAEPNSPMGGTYYHQKQTNESVMSESIVPQEFIDRANELRPNRFSSWAVIDLNDINLMPQYFEKRSKALEYYKWMKINPKNKAVIVNLDESINFNKNGLSINDDKILGKYNLKGLILSKNGNYVTLNKIVANEFGNGYGSRFMEELTKMADDNGWILALTPDTSFGGTSVGRLKNFYKRFGFKPNKGRNTDFNTRESMVRKPNKSKNIIIPENKLGIIKENIEPETESLHTFENWFGNSILKDNDGNPLKMYHGTDKQFDSFDKNFIGSTGSYEGYGFNFTPDEHRARVYNPNNVIAAYLKVENPMTTKSNKITLRELVKIIAELDKGVPFTDTIVAAYEPARCNEKWDENYYRRALPAAARTIYNYNKECEYGDAGIYAEICLCGQADKIKTIDTFEKLGYDSAMFYDSNNRLTTVVVFEPNQIKRITNKTFNIDSANMNENIEPEVSSSEVDLSSFKKRDTLPPGIWKDEDTLDPRVRLKLLDIADDFWEFINLSWVEPKGIIITGSICNFNWSKFSDIDLHIVADFKEIDEKTEFVKQYLDSKKNEWNNEHEGLKIMGFPVELYVQDVDDDIEAGGIYDLEENKWVRKPNPHSVKSIGLNKFSIKDKAAEIMTIIDDMYGKLSTTTDGHEIDQIGDDAHYLWDKVKDLRKKSLNKNGESGSGNIVYKVLRRTGYLDRLFKLFSTVYDRSNSITESMKRYLTVLKEEVAIDGSSEDNPYEKRWKAEREALKSFVANYGKLMQSREDNKGGKLYKVYFDETMSNLIGYNYCICVQWNEQEMKPGSTVYIRALDKFTPFIRRDLQFDTRGKDNMRGTYDDTGY